MEPLQSWGNSAAPPADEAEPIANLCGFPFGAEQKPMLAFARDQMAPAQPETSWRLATKEAAQTFDSKNEFLSRMRHELMTPLNSVLGFGRLLQQQAVSVMQEDCARQVVRGGERLLHLIDELLEASRLTSSAVEPAVEPVSVAEIVRKVAEEMREPAAKRKMIIGICPDPSPPCLVLADRPRLRQILLRLLAVAAKFGAEGSAIVLEYYPLGGEVRLCIHHHGSGIPPDGFSRLFPAGAPPAELTAGLGDAGISLVLCRHLVEALHGTIGAENCEGKGSTFWVQLAAAEHHEPAPTLVEEATVADSGQGHAVLYIDDDESNLKLIEYLLTANGDVRLLTATTGVAGVEAAVTHRPSLILLDLHLRDLSGEEILAQLRANPATRNIPVVAVSGETDAAKIKRLKEAGLNSFLSKPINLPQVQNVLLTILKRPIPQHSAA